jgi:hypothetical protein
MVDGGVILIRPGFPAGWLPAPVNPVRFLQQ